LLDCFNNKKLLHLNYSNKQQQEEKRLLELDVELRRNLAAKMSNEATTANNFLQTLDRSTNAFSRGGLAATAAAGKELKLDVGIFDLI
jgi:hypothetical protein